MPTAIPFHISNAIQRWTPDSLLLAFSVTPRNGPVSIPRPSSQKETGSSRLACNNVSESENIASTIGDGLATGIDVDDAMTDEKENNSQNIFCSTSHGKLKALIDLKQLRLVEKQLERHLRALIAE
ncbi:ATP-dependent DNA helicase Snf21 [Stygiomarasmius scandens]|uniref:ATP-dependent DNA helicase Snf21 n=1 Tax=Marasmiellus scandens TaxID=2682957 RepID=A0ABR1J5H7_9AGAR